ncbi:MobC family plasmid mobilization relaxosome protein [Reichenbachiella ulvae]|uniref:MobC family plasmid mobilization relaxosome protein n=1 Tax=Reichenbachiella ulvae TaxID=2980104 RepID=A0ABT3CZN2_9BACT|nr:MobC family plasmid mobilization relaxosome protein [Reichenbachiella ulvae]MCV9389156.1 MobC family plasmid mobilization relaxosome protein [Reichenbachiella ulvae]
MARPRINKEKLRSKVLTFRCSDIDAKEIRKYCDLHKIGLLDLILIGIKRSKPSHISYPIMKGIKSDLYRIGNNLNQISKALNSGSNTARFAAIARIKELRELKDQLDRINQQIK